jgi:hypothetical protein
MKCKNSGCDDLKVLRVVCEAENLGIDYFKMFAEPIIENAFSNML